MIRTFIAKYVRHMESKKNPILKEEMKKKSIKKQVFFFLILFFSCSKTGRIIVFAYCFVVCILPHFSLLLTFPDDYLHASVSKVQLKALSVNI